MHFDKSVNIFCLDKHIAEKVDWLSDLVKLCGRLYSKFMWGNYFDRLETASSDLGIDFVSLANFSTTRFANSKVQVFKKVKHSFSDNCIRSCL